MREYVIVTDSCCDFDQALIDSLDLTVIPLSVQLGQDRFHNTPQEAPPSHVFYTRLAQGEPAQTGPEGEKRLESLLGLLQALQGQELIGEITEIDASLSTEISMVYQGRIKATMLTSADFNRRSQSFEAVVALAGEYDRGTVNLKTEKVFFTLDN